MKAKDKTADARRDRATGGKSSEKIVLSVRMPMEVAAFIQEEARARALAAGVSESDLPEPGERALNMTRMVNTILDAVRTYFSLPAVLVEKLEADRKALKLTRLEYLQHVVYMRSEAITRHGPGFDRSGPTSTKGGPRHT